MFKFFAILCNKNLLTELSIGDHIRLAHIPRESLVQTKIATKFQDFANVAKFSCAGNSGLNTASLKVQNILNSNHYSKIDSHLPLGYLKAFTRTTVLDADKVA